jgi:hypothetical protein
MKALLYTAVVVLLVPVQTTLLPHLAIWDIKPDLGLVLSALIGVLAGELEGLLVGLAIGWVLNLYSAGDLWLNLLTTGGAGLFAGLLGRHIAEVTPTVLSVSVLLLSLTAGFVAVFGMNSVSISDTWWMVQAVVIPQACFDAAVGSGLLWLLRQRFLQQRFGALERYS